MAKPDMEVIKEIPGYKVILKAVLKSQIQQLVEQLASTTEEESVILTASVSDGTLCHLGSDSGKVFLEDHEDIKSQFLGFCLKRHHKQKQEKERKEAQEREEALARSMAPVTPPRYGGPRFMPRSPRYPSPQQGLHPVALSRVSPGGRMRSPGVRHQPYPMARPTRPSLNFDQQGPNPRMGNKIDGQIIKIEPEDDDDKSNQSVNDSVQTTSSVPGNSEPPSPSTKPSTPSLGQGPQMSDNDDAKSESSSSTIPNEASDLKYSDSVPPGGLSLDSDLSNLISPTDSNAHQAANSQDSSGEPQTPTGLDPNVSVKLEAVTESEMDLEITGVELGQNQMQDQMSSQEWMSNVQNVMQGASGSAADMASQQGYRLSHNVYKGVTRKGYKIPTPIQRKTIPIIMDGKDVVAMARTGSGKTAAFLIPMFEHLKTHCAKSGARALVMSPTRELALQTLKFAKELGKYTGLRAAVVLGGDRMEDQFAALHANPDIIIATPGRFMHVAVEMDLKLKSIQYIVFDEADRLFEMGFQEQLNEILNRLPESRQTVLFSATLPKLLVDFAKAGLHDPMLIRLDVDTKLSDQLKLSFLQCRADDKLGVLLHILKHMIPPDEQTVVFAATKHHVEYLNMVLQKADVSCTYIYSSLDPTARKINLAKFQHRKVMVMIVTDLAARGIDIPLLDNVINYNFPAKAKLFVHRVGRVARAGRSGVAFSLIAPDEVAYVVDLHVFLGRPLKFVPLGKQVKDEDGLYGTVPQTIIDDLSETIFAWHEESYDIKAMVKVCSNAYGHYIRSRPPSAPESVKRVKEMEKLGQHIGTHPMFGLDTDSSEAERLNLLNALKSYKSNTTIFEINSTAKNSSFNVMKKKRNWHDKVVESKVRHAEENQLEPGSNKEEFVGTSQQETADDADIENAFSVVIGGKLSKASGKNQSESSSQVGKKRKRKEKEGVRDEENYISYRPSDYQTEQGLRLGSSFDREASGAMLDLTGDDENIARKRNNVLKWDRKKKKYVRESNEDPKKKKIRTESGALIPASYKSNAYKEWVKKSKTDTQVEKDEDDDLSDKQNRTKNKLAVLGVTEYNRRHVKGSDIGYQGNKRDKFKKKGSELKRPEQIAKARKLKAKKEAFQSQRQRKHQVNKAKHKSRK